MNIYDYKRAIRTMGDVSLDDKAMVVSRMTKDGQIITRNMGDLKARQQIYAALRVLPANTDGITSTVRLEEEDDTH